MPLITRSAIFRGRILPGQHDLFYAIVREKLLPAWQNMEHAQAVRVYRPSESEPGFEDVFLVQQIDYPSRAAMNEALQSPRRQAAVDVMQALKPLYDGFHHHVIYDHLHAL